MFEMAGGEQFSIWKKRTYGTFSHNLLDILYFNTARFKLDDLCAGI